MHIPFRRRTLTGAWIETLVFLCSESCLAGRTLTGAWIETSNGVQLVHVTLTGAWIETFSAIFLV